MTFLLFVLIFGLVVVSHEFGHFIIAKANGIHVVEFSVGMGPDIFSFKKGETKYSLKWFPIGGACMFEGEDGLNVAEGEESEGSFNKASVWARIATVFAGPFFNMILAFIVAVVMVGMLSKGYAIRNPIATDVVEGGAAYEAGMEAGDTIISLNGERIYLYDEIILFSAIYSGGEVELVYERDGQRYTTQLLPKYSEEDGRYLIGIMNSDFAEIQGLSIFKYAYYEVRYSMKSTYKSLLMLFGGRVSRKDVAGPVGIAVNVVGATYEAAKDYGWQSVVVNMLNIVLLLTVNLGILNLLPFPALDGGRLVFLFIEVFRRKPVPPDKEGMVHFIGLMFFMALMVFVFLNDIVNIFM